MILIVRQADGHERGVVNAERIGVEAAGHGCCRLVEPGGFAMEAPAGGGQAGCQARVRECPRAL